MSRAIGILVAAGTSTRFGGDVPKQFLDLGGETVVARAARALSGGGALEALVVVLAPDEIGGARAAAVSALPGVSAVVAGGPRRMLSTLAGAEAAEGADVVLVHDAARPFVSATLVREVLDATRRHGAAVPALPARETVKRADADGFIAETVDRTSLRLAQTPQGARRDWLIEALRQAVADGVDVTDEAQALERAGRRVALVDGDPRNVKLTTSADWDTAPRVDPREAGWRVGTGFDIHRFAPGRSLKLGGVEFDGEIGLAGHSDADVVLHAAMDAVLGAAGRPDIGQIFPPDDPAFAGADSTMLARRVAALVLEDGWRVVNIDLTVLAERPKILPRSGAMKAAVGACFEVPASCVGIKATTLEGLGALGRAEGIACQAIVMLGRTVPYR